MAYAPTLLPAVSAVTVGVTETTITLPVGFTPKLGVLLLQRSGDAGLIYWALATGVTTSTGALVSKGVPGSTNQYFIPREVFESTRVLYVISGTAAQTLDVVIV